MKLKLKNVLFCDGCSELQDLHTLGGHKRCKVYKKNFLPDESLLIENHGQGTIKRPEICQNENEAEKTK